MVHFCPVLLFLSEYHKTLWSAHMYFALRLVAIIMGIVYSFLKLTCLGDISFLHTCLMSSYHHDMWTSFNIMKVNSGDKSSLQQLWRYWHQASVIVYIPFELSAKEQFCNNENQTLTLPGLSVHVIIVSNGVPHKTITEKKIPCNNALHKYRHLVQFHQ